MRWFTWAGLYLAALLFFLLSWQASRYWHTTDGPAIEYTKDLNLGAREVGEEVTGIITVFNRGGKDLIMDEVHTSCSCSGLHFTQGERQGLRT